MADVKTLIQSIINATSAALAQKSSISLSTGSIIHRAYPEIQQIAEDANEQPTLSSDEAKLLAFVHALVNKLRTLPGKLDQPGPNGEPSILAQLQNLKSETTAQGVVDALQDAKLTQAFQAISHLTDGELNDQINKLAAMTDKQIAAARKAARKSEIGKAALGNRHYSLKLMENTSTRTFNPESETHHEIKEDVIATLWSTYEITQVETHLKDLFMTPNDNSDEIYQAFKTYQETQERSSTPLPDAHKQLILFLSELDKSVRDNFLKSLKKLIQYFFSENKKTEVKSALKSKANLEKFFKTDRPYINAESILSSILSSTDQRRAETTHSFQTNIIDIITQHYKIKPHQPNTQELIEQKLSALFAPISTLTPERQKKLLSPEQENSLEVLSSEFPNADLTILLKSLAHTEQNSFLSSLRQLGPFSQNMNITDEIREIRDNSDTYRKAQRLAPEQMTTAQALTEGFSDLTQLSEDEKALTKSFQENFTAAFHPNLSSIDSQADKEDKLEDKSTLNSFANAKIRHLANTQFANDTRANSFAAHLIRRLFFYKVRGENTALFSDKDELKEQVTKANSFLEENNLPEAINRLRSSIEATDPDERNFIENHLFSSLIAACTPSASIQTLSYDSATYAKQTLEGFLENVETEISEANALISFINSKIDEDRNSGTLPKWTRNYLLNLPNLSAGNDPARLSKQSEFSKGKCNQIIQHLKTDEAAASSAPAILEKTTTQTSAEAQKATIQLNKVRAKVDRNLALLTQDAPCSLAGEEGKAKAKSYKTAFDNFQKNPTDESKLSALTAAIEELKTQNKKRQSFTKPTLGLSLTTAVLGGLALGALIYTGLIVPATIIGLGYITYCAATGTAVLGTSTAAGVMTLNRQYKLDKNLEVLKTAATKAHEAQTRLAPIKAAKSDYDAIVTPGSESTSETAIEETAIEASSYEKPKTIFNRMSNCFSGFFGSRNHDYERVNNIDNSSEHSDESDSSHRQSSVTSPGKDKTQTHVHTLKTRPT